MEDVPLESQKIDPNLQCNVCGERDFDVRAGFYFCRECGTKKEQVREIEIDAEVQYRDAKHTKIQKIKTNTIDKPNLTSWECYNYILRGLVDELLQLGAKEEFKLITLQLWAAYLRRKEVAFFNKKYAELPKLGARFLKRDANILYNHVKTNRRKRKRSECSSHGTSGDSTRDWRKSKRKLDESLYSATTDNSESKTSILTSSTGTTSRAIQLNFSSYARKVFKKTIPVKHLKKHEQDDEGILKCHRFPPKVQSLTMNELLMARTTIREMYTILAIALNLAEDTIQLSDLVRFISETHIGTKNVLHYFPENVIIHGKEILTDINFHRSTDKANYRTLRDNIQFISKLIGLQEYRTPDLVSLAKRYITELNLPTELAMYVERLMNLLPPQMKTRSSKIYPAYEARAMAYIIFILKLMFGLDGHKEQQISESAKDINAEIETATKRSAKPPSKLFVWSEWVEYIEMRKVVISQYNSVYANQFKMEQPISHKIEELNEMMRCKNERDNIASDAPSDVSALTTEITENLQRIMKKFIENRTEKEDLFPSNEIPQAITFQPSFMPSDSYFKRIRLHCAISADRSSSNNYLKIPEFMNVDHSLRSLESYLEPNSLKKFFQDEGVQLNVKSVPCTNNKNYVGIFISGREMLPLTVRRMNAYKADFKITEEAWLKSIVGEPMPGEVVFKEKLDCYEKQYMKKLTSQALKRQQTQLNDQNEIVFITKRETDILNSDVLSMHSIEIFSENNMDPLDELNLAQPRRLMDSINLFNSDPSTDNINTESSSGTEDDLSINCERNLTFLTSEMDCWLLIGHIGELLDLQKKNLQAKFPRSFFWLVETCANMIHVDWGTLYDQLMALEIMFAYGIESLDDFKNCVRFKHLNSIKDLNILINWYREIW